MLNITAIDLWERASATQDEEVASAHEQNLTLGLLILAGGSLLFASMFAVFAELKVSDSVTWISRDKLTAPAVLSMNKNGNAGKDVFVPLIVSFVIAITFFLMINNFELHL